tara:strand:- start:51190 stop:51438 length:249 start_codon:yes stop_codon:yes gene_type:complete
MSKREISYESQAAIANLKKHGIHPPPYTMPIGSFIEIEEQKRSQKKAEKAIIQRRNTNKSPKLYKRRKANKIARLSRKANRK